MPTTMRLARCRLRNNVSNGRTGARGKALMVSLGEYLKAVSQTIRAPVALDVGFLTVAHFAGAALGFASVTAAARILGPTGYGIAALVMAYPALLRSFLSVKSASVTTRYVATFRSSGHYSRLAWVCRIGYQLDLLISLLVLALVGATSWWVSQSVLDVPGLSWLVVAFAASFPLASLTGTSKAILTSWREFRWIAALDICERALTLVLVVSFLLAGWEVPGLVLGTAIGQAIAGIGAAGISAYVLHRDGVRLWRQADAEDVPKLRNEIMRLFGWNYLLTTFVGVVENGPVLLLGHLRGPREAGFLRLAATLVGTMSYAEEALKKVAYPTLAVRLSSQTQSEIRIVLRRWTRYAGVPLTLAILFAILIAPLVIPLLFGDSYAPMTTGLQVMMFGVAVSSLFFWRYPYYLATGGIRLPAQAFGVYALATLVLGWIVADIWGFVGIAVLVTTGLLTVTSFLVARAWKQLDPKRVNRALR
jgi:O-antigen/teichoic acid export membrane protein